MGKVLIIKGADFSENAIPGREVTWLTNYVAIANEDIIIEGHGWTMREGFQPIGYTITHLRFKTLLETGTFELGVAPQYGCTLEQITGVQSINFSSFDKDENNVCSLLIPNPITLNTGEFIVLFPATEPSAGVFYYGINNQISFYSGVPISRRGGANWRVHVGVYLGVDFGYIAD